MGKTIKCLIADITEALRESHLFQVGIGVKGLLFYSLHPCRDGIGFAFPAIGIQHKSLAILGKQDPVFPGHKHLVLLRNLKCSHGSLPKSILANFGAVPWYENLRQLCSTKRGVPNAHKTVWKIYRLQSSILKCKSFNYCHVSK